MDNHKSHTNAETTAEPVEIEETHDAKSPNPVLEWNVGKAMPSTLTKNMPVLHPQTQSVVAQDSPVSGQTRSMLAQGMLFVGHAVLRGPCSIAGMFEGNVTQAAGSVVSVVVTETGRVKGDITAQKISVMGHTDGILDAGQGEVSLHDTARVQGLVRYGRIQVNGADLNATLERVAISGQSH